jgi:hypothetical protein
MMLGALRGRGQKAREHCIQGVAETWNMRRASKGPMPFNRLAPHSRMAARTLGAEPSWALADVGRWGRQRACLHQNCWFCSHCCCCCCCCSAQGCRAGGRQGRACRVLLPWAWQGWWPRALPWLLMTRPCCWLTWLAAAAGRPPRRSCSLGPWPSDGDLGLLQLQAAPGGPARRC